MCGFALLMHLDKSILFGIIKNPGIYYFNNNFILLIKYMIEKRHFRWRANREILDGFY